MIKYQHKRAIANPLFKESGMLDSALKSQPSNFDGISQLNKGGGAQSPTGTAFDLDFSQHEIPTTNSQLN